MLEWLPRTEGPILECGSGLSTLLLLASVMRSGRRIHSLEHDSEWAQFASRRIPERLRPGISLQMAPLKSYGEFEWYDVDPNALSRPIGYVVCDGPPAVTRGGRYGLAPVLGKHLAPDCVILLDDTQRSGERAIVDRWRSELGAAILHDGETFMVLRTGSPGRRI